MFYEGGWYSTMNSIFMIHFSPFMQTTGRKFLCNYITKILLIFIIKCRLIMWSLLCSMIIIGGTGCSTRTSIFFYIIFTRAVWLMLYKYPQKKVSKKFQKTIKCMIYISICILLTFLQKNNVSADGWVIFIQYRPCTKILNFIIFHRWYFSRLFTLIVRVWYIIMSVIFVVYVVEHP